jgi:hypothetical protein
MLLVFLLGFCLLVPNVAAVNCTFVNSTQCGMGACLGYTMINSNCTLNCGSGSYHHNLTGTCMDCSYLGSSECSMNCPGFYYVVFPSGNYSNTKLTITNNTNNTNSSSTVPPTCLPCSGLFGNGCTACSWSKCTNCTIGLGLASDNHSCVDTNCSIANCLQCVGKDACYIC